MIKSTSFNPGGDTNFHILLHAAVSGDWVTHIVNETTGDLSQGHYTSILRNAFHDLRERAEPFNAVVDWASYLVPCGEYYVVSREARQLAGCDVTVHKNRQAFDDYRRSLLTDFYDNYYQDEDKVDALMTAGDLDGAWQQATDGAADPDGDSYEKEDKWNSHFGSFHVTIHKLEVPFTDLPEWVQETVKRGLL